MCKTDKCYDNTWRYACPKCGSVSLKTVPTRNGYYCKVCRAKFKKAVDKYKPEK